MTEKTRWFEDFTAGEVIPLGSRALGRDEIVAFARDWDPQPMHVDEEAGRASLLGSLSASGWHTACVLMRLFADTVLADAASLGSPGIASLKWLKPVRPGDRLTATLIVRETRTSASRPTLGLVRAEFEVVGDDGAPVMTMDSTLMMARRPTP